MGFLSSFISFLAVMICISNLPVGANNEDHRQSPTNLELPELSISNENGMTKIIRRQLPKNVIKIVAGDPNFVFDKALAKEYPWMVSIEAKFSKYYQCSPSSRRSYIFEMVTNGVLISNQWILTSASGLYWNGNATITPCNNPDDKVIYYNPPINEVTITLGGLDMGNSNLSVLPSDIEPQRVVIDSRLILLHPEFNFEEKELKLPFDLALIQLPEPIEFNEFISPITLPNGAGNSIENLTMVSYGFLIQDTGIFTSDQMMGRSELRKSDVIMVQPNDECQPTFPLGNLNDSYVSCFSGLGYAYWGDQGAAMVYRDSNEESNWTLAAVASMHNYYDRYKRPSANTTGYSVAVKVKPHLGWINSVLNDESITQPPDYPATTLGPISDGNNLEIPDLSTVVSLTAFHLLFRYLGHVF